MSLMPCETHTKKQAVKKEFQKRKEKTFFGDLAFTSFLKKSNAITNTNTKH